MTTTEHIRMTQQDHSRLLNELIALRSQHGLQDGIEAPDDFLDYHANVIARYCARKARIREIEELLTSAIVGAGVVGDVVARPGMVVTIRYESTGQTETFLLGRRGAENADIPVYSTLSPLGRAIIGARLGERRVYSIPQEADLVVTLLAAVPYQGSGDV
ncbi:hypothetical protein B1987_26465 [Mycobacterium kansasii]|uniref:Transcription elongation factor GreA n=1 Tax=Mycobacterium attenuatum TaxID=2341086 RepID=A0A498Q282_9MYCO|nr:GreA/GreB family elongation factor [Mycobacterium attenuatum]ORB86726.1 hypothetical protein B1987_26465 [Mycobacterium kansasii]VBA37980.1 Transcription elongation factor GreA [Mycobacterium attenuatum]